MKIDKNTVVPIGFATAIIASVGSGAWFGGGFFERLSQFDPIKLEHRLSSIHTDVATVKTEMNALREQVAKLDRKMDRYDPSRASFPMLSRQPITEKTADTYTGDKDSTQQPIIIWNPDIRHWPGITK